MSLASIFHKLNQWYFGAPKGTYVPPHALKELTPEQQKLIRDFHTLYYDLWNERRGTIDLSWFGFHTLKCPLDLWIYQELIAEVQPTLIVECGTHAGGSAFFLASMCELNRRGRVVSIDIQPNNARPRHPLIDYVTGSSIDPGIVSRILSLAATNERVMVILDSDHSCAHVLAEMRTYHTIVSPGSYMIVEDSAINGHPVLPHFGPGPMEAIEQFMRENSDFQIDSSRERFLLTLNPRGYLKKKAT